MCTNEFSVKWQPREALFGFARPRRVGMTLTAEPLFNENLKSFMFYWNLGIDRLLIHACLCIRSSASNLSGRPFELPRPRETSRSTSGSSHSTNYSRPVPSSGGDSSEPVISTSRDARSSTAVSPRYYVFVYFGSFHLRGNVP